MAEWVTVHETHAPLESEILKGLLETSGIPVRVKAEGLKAFSVIFGASAPGTLKLQVPEDWEQLAREILAAPVELDEDAIDDK